MKKKYITLIIFIISAVSYSQNNISNKNNLILEGIKGKVKKITYSDGICKNKFGKMAFYYDQNTGGRKDWIYNYNTLGYITEEKMINYEDKVIAYRIVSKYNKINLVEQKRYNEKNKEEWKSLKKYNTKNQITEDLTVFNLAKSSRRDLTKYYYDKKNRLIHSDIIDQHGKLKELEQYKYDAKNNIIEDVYYDNYGDLSFTKKNIYDKKSNLTQIRSYDQNNKLVKKIIYTYDALNRKKEEHEFNYKDNHLDNTEDTTYYSYDKNNNCISELKIFYDVELNSHKKYENIIKRFIEYDKHNNWIKKIESLNSEQEGCSIRKIEYY